MPDNFPAIYRREATDAGRGATCLTPHGMPSNGNSTPVNDGWTWNFAPNRR